MTRKKSGFLSVSSAVNVFGEARGFRGEAWALAVGNELLIVRESQYGFVTLLRSEQDFDVEWSKPQPAYA